MTNEEAIRILTKLQEPGIYEPSITGEAFDALQMGIDALSKQIPRKPIRIDKNGVFDGNWDKVCPVCGRILTKRITTETQSYPRLYNISEYCWCGQRLLWEE